MYHAMEISDCIPLYAVVNIVCATCTYVQVLTPHAKIVSLIRSYINELIKEFENHFLDILHFSGASF